MADTRINTDGSVEHKCHSCDQWKDSHLFEDVRDSTQDPDYMTCPACRGEDG